MRRDNRQTGSPFLERPFNSFGVSISRSSRVSRSSLIATSSSQDSRRSSLARPQLPARMHFSTPLHNGKRGNCIVAGGGQPHRLAPENNSERCFRIRPRMAGHTEKHINLNFVYVYASSHAKMQVSHKHSL